MRRGLIGHVTVDSGQLLLIDPCYIIGGLDYEAICEKTLGSPQYGVWNFGVAFASGYGDGVYPVYATINSDGRVVKVEIIMDEEVDDE